MQRISVMAVAVAAVLLVSGVSAQGKPDLSGKWTLVPDPNAAPAGGGGGGGRGGRGGRGGGGGQAFCGNECTITQDATTLTVTRTTQGGEQKAMYRLDGSESKNSQQGRGGESVEVVSKATWDGAKLSIETTQPGRQGGANITRKSVVTMNGGQMEVENTVDAGQGPQTTKQVYKKG
jgi:hypothetical protein